MFGYKSGENPNWTGQHIHYFLDYLKWYFCEFGLELRARKF